MGFLLSVRFRAAANPDRRRLCEPVRRTAWSVVGFWRPPLEPRRRERSRPKKEGPSSPFGLPALTIAAPQGGPHSVKALPWLFS